MSNKTSKLKTALGVVAGILAVVLIGGLFTFTKLSDSGFFLRHTISVKSENYEVNNAQMSYFYSQNYSSSMMNNSSYYEYYGYDSTKSPSAQQYPGGGTWYNYFMEDVTVPAVEQILILCEAARAAGYEMPEEEKASIDEAIANIESRAKEEEVTTSYYVMNYYGIGVNLKDVRSAMELSQYAYSYYNSIMESFEFTEADWDAYYAENEDSFQRIDYLAYTFSVEDIAHLNEDEEAETEEATETEAETEADTEAADEEDEHTHDEFVPVVENYANELAACKTVDEFNAYVEAFLNDVMYAAEEDADAKAEDVASDMDELAAEGVAYSDSDETLVELFKLGEGETYTEVNEEDGEYTVHLITKPKYIEDYLTKNARLIMVSGDSDEVASDLKAISDALTEDPSEEKFIELAKEYSADTATAENGALYENVAKGDFSSEAMMEWLFDDERVEGDVEVFAMDETDATASSSSVYYYAAMYEGDGMIKWQYDTNETLISEAYNEKYSEFEAAHGGDKLSVSLEDLYKIPN